MSISPSQYVNIISGVGASANVPTRDLIGRFFTGNTLLPPQNFVEFSNATEVLNFFGSTSEEYARAAFYFSFISKTLVQPAAIQFARWTSSATAPTIQSPANNAAVLATMLTITNGSFGITIGATVGVFTGADLTGESDFAGIATYLTGKITGTFASGVISYNGNYGFNFTSGVTGAATISVQGELGGTDLTELGNLGWLPEASFTNGIYVPGAIVSNGSAAETITETLTASVSLSNNFGSFLFLNNLNLTLANAVLAATWNQSENNMFLFCVPVTSSNYSSWVADSGGLGLLGGTAVTLSGAQVQYTGILTSTSANITGLPTTEGLSIGMPVNDGGSNIPAGTIITSIAAYPSTTVTMSNAATGSGSEIITFVFNQFPEQIPMMIEAATDYYAINSVQNYMFQGPFAGLTPLVTTDVEKNTYDAVSVNYYGNTQQAGVPLNFYQNGVLQGASPSPLDMTSYVNEIWLKDAITTQILNLFLSSTQIPANAQGRAQILASLQEIINQALNNGTISVNKTLTSAQQMFITSQSGDPDAWYQVQSIGYWVDCSIVYASSMYTATYILIYSKDDVIRLVTGQDILI